VAKIKGTPSSKCYKGGILSCGEKLIHLSVNGVPQGLTRGPEGGGGGGLAYPKFKGQAESAFV
jgi:hypothetical protein